MCGEKERSILKVKRPAQEHNNPIKQGIMDRRVPFPLNFARPGVTERVRCCLDSGVQIIILNQKFSILNELNVVHQDNIPSQVMIFYILDTCLYDNVSKR